MQTRHSIGILYVLIHDKCNWFDWPPFIMYNTKKAANKPFTFVMNQLLINGNTHTGYLYYVEFA